MASPGSIVKLTLVASIIGMFGVAYLDDEHNNSKPRDPAEDDATEVFAASHAAACGDLGQATLDAVLQKAIENAQARAKASGTDPQNQIDNLYQKKQDGWDYSQNAGCSGLFAPAYSEQSAMAFILLPGEGEAADTAGRPTAASSPAQGVTSTPASTPAATDAVVATTPQPSNAQVAPGTPTNQQTGETDEQAAPDPSKGQTSTPAQPSVPEQSETQTSSEQSKVNPIPSTNNSAQQAYWYYCDPAKAYFPYVRQCSVPWRPVAANRPPDGGQ